MTRLLAGVVTVAVVAVAATVVAVNMNYSDTSEFAKRPPLSYVALGDSIAAGIGTGDYSDASACDRTKGSYPARLASEKNFTLTNLACSGATIPAGINGPQTVNNLKLKSQLDVLFARSEAPDIITITIGANDIGWTRFVECYVTNCDSVPQLTALQPVLEAYEQSLSTALERVERNYDERTMPRAIVTGYFQIVPGSEGASCVDTRGLDDSEKELARAVMSKLNETIRETVDTFDFATYATIDFEGHEFCTRDTWVQGLNDKYPFHPNQKGQAAIARQLANVIESE